MWAGLAGQRWRRKLRKVSLREGFPFRNEEACFDIKAVPSRGLHGGLTHNSPREETDHATVYFVAKHWPWVSRSTINLLNMPRKNQRSCAYRPGWELAFIITFSFSKICKKEYCAIFAEAGMEDSGCASSRGRSLQAPSDCD